jgi:hypothetical protein
MGSGRSNPVKDHFPTTPKTWVLERIRQGAIEKRALNNRLMSLYARPLRTYVRGSSFRSFGDADEIVNGFFASRLSDENYLHEWAASGLRLRRWLMNGILLYLHEQVRRTRRDKSVAPLPTALAAAIDRSVERAYARSVVREAMAQAQKQCAAEDMSRHWQAFLARHSGDGALEAFRIRHGLTPGQASHLVRAATARFRKALVDLVLLDGASRDEAESEILRLLRSLQA